MKNQVPSSVVYGVLLVVILAAIWYGYRLVGPSPADRAAVGVLEVSARLGKAHGDASKLSAEDQEFIKKHPNAFRTIDSARFTGPTGKTQSGPKGNVNQPVKQSGTAN